MTDTRSVPRRDPSLSVACVLFVLSGAAGLIYRVAWQRILALTTGVTVHSVAIHAAVHHSGKSRLRQFPVRFRLPPRGPCSAH